MFKPKARSLMLRWFHALMPKEERFFELFAQHSRAIVAGAEALRAMMEGGEAIARNYQIVMDRENDADIATREVLIAVRRTFITPFDREDIHALTAALDDIVDFIHGSAKRIELYKVTEIHPSFIKLSELIEKGAGEIHNAVSELRNMKNVNKIKEACVRINSIENHADDIFDMTIAQLFEEEKDAIKVIKIKEILSALETATDKCEDVANVLETIILKSA